MVKSRLGPTSAIMQHIACFLIIHFVHTILTVYSMGNGPYNRTIFHMERIDFRGIFAVRGGQ